MEDTRTLDLFSVAGAGLLWGTGGLAGALLAVGVLAAWYQSCYFTAVSLTTVGMATLVTLGTAPVLVVLAESVLARRHPRPASAPSRCSAPDRWTGSARCRRRGWRSAWAG